MAGFLPRVSFIEDTFGGEKLGQKLLGSVRVRTSQSRHRHRGTAKDRILAIRRVINLGNDQVHRAELYSQILTAMGLTCIFNFSERLIVTRR